MADDEIERIVNACDAGREGELIFAYVYDLAKVKKPVERLWLSSMTKKAIGEAFEQLRPGEEMKPLEAAARSRSEADWVVGHERHPRRVDPPARGVRRRRSLGRVQTPTLALVARREEEIRAFKPEPYWLVEAQLRGDRRAPLLGPLPGRQAAPAEERGHGDRRGRRPGSRARSRSSRRRRSASARSSSTTSPRSSATRTRSYGFSARRTLAAAQRLYEEHKALTYPRTNSRFLTGDMIAEIKPIAELVGHNPQYAKGAEYVLGARQAAARAGGQRQEGPGPPRDHPHALRARPRPHGRRTS